MPVSENWLEELVVEWLELEGFLTLIGPPVRGPAGGVLPPDVVGARVGAGGRLEIRHCEAAMWFAQGPQAAAAAYQKKFSRGTRDQVWAEFSRLFAVPGPPDYEPWIICCEVGKPVASALHGAIQALQSKDPSLKDLQLRSLVDFLPEVRTTITGWRKIHPQVLGLPQSKWLLTLLDYMVHYRIWP